MSVKLGHSMNNKLSANKHRGRHVYRIYSRKNKASLKTESYLECRFARVLEIDPCVVAFAAQPESLHIKLNNKSLRYTPDFLVRYLDRPAEYIEVHSSDRLTPEFIERVELFSAYVQDQAGCSIVIKTEQDLPLLNDSNLVLIADNMNHQLSFAKERLLTYEPTTFAELVEYLYTTLSSQPIQDAYYLLACGYYQLHQPQVLMSADSPIFRGE